MKQIIKAIWKSNEVPTNEYFLWLKYEEGGFILYVKGQRGWEPITSKGQISDTYTKEEIDDILNNYYTKEETDDAIANGTCASADKLTTARRIFNVPFDGTQNINGSDEAPIYLHGNILSNNIYPTYHTRSLGGSGKASNIWTDKIDGVETPARLSPWGAIYSYKICHGIENNVWQVSKALCSAGNSTLGTEPIGVIDIRIPTLQYAHYKVTVNSVYGSPIIYDTIEFTASALSSGEIRVLYKENGPSNLNIQLAETTNSSNKKERHLLIGDTDTQYHSLMVTVDMNLVPGSQVGPTASIDRPASIYIDDVYAYIQMSVVQSLTGYTMLSFLNS